MGWLKGKCFASKANAKYIVSDMNKKNFAG